MPKLIGNNPNQVSTNGMLGNMAFQNREAVSVGGLVSTGNVAIGTTSASERLVVSGTTGAANIRLVDGGTAANTVWIGNRPFGATVAGIYTEGASSLALGTNATERMRIDGNGNIGIGTTADVRLRVAAASPTNGIIQTILATGSTGAQLNFGQSSVADWVIGQPAGANAFAFWTNRNISSAGTELMRLDSSGNLGIGITPTAKLHVASGNAILGTAVGNTTTVPDQTALEYTTDTLPTIRPTLLLDFVNTSVLDSRITFTRSSTGTYYDGRTTALAEQNLFTYSEQFDNAAWTKSNATVSANSTTAPDGTSTADSLIENTANAFHAAVQSFTLSGNTTISCYMKANTRTFASLRTYDATNGDRYAVFDLSNGTAGALSGGTTSTITAVGNGWYRCTMTYNYTSASGSAGIGIQNANSYVAYTGDGTSGIFIWGAQIEQRSTATAYTATTASPITNYIPVLRTAATNAPRFDYDPVTQTPRGLLIEEQRSNLLTYSEQFDNAAWTKTAVTVTANTAISPDGTADAEKVIEDSTTALHFIRQNPTVSAAAHTLSFYAKAAERSVAWASVDGASNTRWFDLSAGTTGGSAGNSGSSTITAVGNGWFRCTYTYTFTGTTSGCFIGPALNSSTLSYAGNGTSGIFVWGAQLEAGSFATSYIPTVASQVTRSADNATMTGTNFSSWYNVSEGTFAASWDVSNINNANGANVVSAYLDANNLIRTWIWSGAQSTPRGTVLASGASSADLTSGTVTANTTIKTAMAYKQNDFGFSLNGGTAVTDTSGSVPSGVNLLGIGQIGAAAGAPLNGHISRIAYYPQRLSNSVLQGMTR